MRIAIFSETFLPKIDGIVTRVTKTVEQLTRAGHKVLLVVPDSGRQSYADAEILNVPAFASPFYPENRIALPRPSIFIALDRFKPDVVHVAGPLMLGIAGVVYARRRSLPLVASYHAHLPKYLEFMGLAPLAPCLWRALAALHDYADLNLCTSTVLLEELQGQGFARLRLWRRAVDVELFQPLRDNTAMRARLSGGEINKALMLYVGRLSAEKEVAQLQALHEHFPQVRLAIVGDGPQRAELESIFAGTPTVFTGYLQGQALAAAYGSADLFVFPSRTETLGLVLLEAMASGCPVVATRAGGVTDICADGETGFLYQPGDRADFVRITKLALASLADAQAKAALRFRCRAEATRWDWQTCVEELLGYYDAACAATVHREPEELSRTLLKLGYVGSACVRALLLGIRIKLGRTDTGTLDHVRTST